jgi:hypothetical protein
LPLSLCPHLSGPISSINVQFTVVYCCKAMTSNRVVAAKRRPSSGCRFTAAEPGAHISPPVPVGIKARPWQGLRRNCKSHTPSKAPASSGVLKKRLYMPLEGGTAARCRFPVVPLLRMVVTGFDGCGTGGFGVAAGVAGGFVAGTVGGCVAGTVGAGGTGVADAGGVPCRNQPKSSTVPYLAPLQQV